MSRADTLNASNMAIEPATDCTAELAIGSAVGLASNAASNSASEAAAESTAASASAGSMAALSAAGHVSAAPTASAASVAPVVAESEAAAFASSAKPLLQVSQLSVAFGQKTVVNAIGYHIQAGEKLAVVGESGSGKTMGALALLGLVDGATVSGQALWTPKGEPACDLLALNERELRGLRGDDIAMVFQEPMTALNPLMSVGAQIAEVVQLKRATSAQVAWARAVELLRETGIPEPEQRARSYPHQLSGGQRQRAVIAMALASEPKLLLADEPTTALDVTLRAQVLDLLAQLQARTGMALMLITHDLNLVRRFADRVLVMQHGVVVEQGAVQQVFDAPAHAYTQRLIQSRPVRNVLPPQADAAPMLQAGGLSVRYPKPREGWRGWWGHDWFVAVQGVQFMLRRGQTLGVIGESGSGKSTLAQAALGLLPFEGDLQVAGQGWQHRESANRALRRRVQVVFQDPFSSLSPRMMVAELVGEGLIVHAPELSAAQREAKVLAVLAEVGLSEAQFPGLLQRYPHEFSGGQRQRLAIARALIVEPELLVLDEPTSALDVTVQQQVLALLQGLQRERGLSFLLITHDMAVVQAMAHEVLVMQHGRVLEQGSTEQVLQHPQHAYTQALLRDAHL